MMGLLRRLQPFPATSNIFAVAEVPIPMMMMSFFKWLELILDDS